MLVALNETKVNYHWCFWTVAHIFYWYMGPVVYVLRTDAAIFLEVIRKLTKDLVHSISGGVSRPVTLERGRRQRNQLVSTYDTNCLVCMELAQASSNIRGSSATRASA